MTWKGFSPPQAAVAQNPGGEVSGGLGPCHCCFLPVEKEENSKEAIPRFIEAKKGL